MKTLKLFIVIGILGIFAFGNINAQPQKEVIVSTDYMCLPDDYAGEELCGDVHAVLTFWEGKFQVRCSGIMEGSVSGDLYTLRETDNSNTKALKEGTAVNDKYVLTMLLKKDGAPAIVCHYQYHLTINANGEVILEFEKYFQSNW